MPIIYFFLSEQRMLNILTTKIFGNTGKYNTHYKKQNKREHSDFQEKLIGQLFPKLSPSNLSRISSQVLPNELQVDRDIASVAVDRPKASQPQDFVWNKPTSVPMTPTREH